MISRTEREKAELALMKYLNGQHRQWGGVFNFGVMGLLHIWWQHSSWQIEWLELEAVPIEVLNELDGD